MDVLTPLGTYGSWYNFYICDLAGSITQPQSIGGVPIPVVGGATIPIPALQNPAPRCTAAGLPNNFGIHDDTSKHANPLVTIPGLGGG
ncbi:MAG: hypothetical protein QOF38_5034 [Pseudonocardiales bacterium]|nr:hypothetical protein [Pseudonocardiales bacterium]